MPAPPHRPPRLLRRRVSSLMMVDGRMVMDGVATGAAPLTADVAYAGVAGVCRPHRRQANTIAPLVRKAPDSERTLLAIASLGAWWGALGFISFLSMRLMRCPSGVWWSAWLLLETIGLWAISFSSSVLLGYGSVLETRDLVYGTL